MSKKRLRPWVVNLLLLIITIILFLFVLEIALRFFLPQQLYVVRPSPWLERENIPNLHTTLINRDTQDKIFIDINSKGFRDYEREYDKLDDVFRILVVGDSFTEARQVQLNETFHKLLESKLGSAEVISAGVSGYGTENNLVYLNKWGFGYKPNIVILQFLATNDIRDNYYGKLYSYNKTEKTILKNYPLKYSSTKKIFDKIRISVNSRFHFGVFLENGLVNLNLIESILLNMGLINKKESSQVKQSFVVEAQPWSDEIIDGWEETKLLIKEMDKECKKQNIHFIVMITPTNFQTYEEDTNEYIEKIEKELNQTTDLTGVEKLLIDFADDNDIETLYLLPNFKEASKNKDLFGKKDEHFTKEAHKLTTDLIYERLINNNLISIK